VSACHSRVRRTSNERVGWGTLEEVMPEGSARTLSVVLTGALTVSLTRRFSCRSVG
jgi:hypothetical protein